MPPMLTKAVSIPGGLFQLRAPLVIGPFRVTFDLCVPNQEVDKTSDSSGEILIVIEGSATQILDAGSQVCGPLSVSYRGPGFPKRDKIGEAGMTALRISVRAAFSHQVERDYFGGDEGPNHYPCGALADVPARVVNECTRVDASPLLVDGLLRLLIATAARSEAGVGRSPGRPPDWLAEGVKLIERSFCEPLRLEEIARAVGVDPAHFSRVFRRYRGLSAKRFISFLRLRYGASVLATTPTPISEIALSLGFCDQAHFTREFKRWAGKSPATFRREYRSATGCHRAKA
jgi:AraC-like DNA-binding protein